MKLQLQGPIKCKPSPNDILKTFFFALFVHNMKKLSKNDEKSQKKVSFIAKSENMTAPLLKIPKSHKSQFRQPKTILATQKDRYTFSSRQWTRLPFFSLVNSAFFPFLGPIRQFQRKNYI